MDEQEQAQQTLMEMVRRDRAEAEAHPARQPRWRLSSLANHWVLAVAVVIFILAFPAFIVIYPRLGPYDTMTSFCTAESDGAYDTAYALLSMHAQQHVSLATFTQLSRTVNLSGCAVSGGIPIILGGTQASLDMCYGFIGSNFTCDGQTVGPFDPNAPPDDRSQGSMTFVRERGGWRLDSMTPDLFDLSS